MSEETFIFKISFFTMIEKFDGEIFVLFGLLLTLRSKRSCFYFSDLEVLSALHWSSSLRNLEKVFSVLWGT